MERLTIRGDHGIFMAPGYDFHIDPDDYDLVQEILARLADYEDTGLEPDMIEATINGQISLQKALAKYTQAEQEGRLVVLPCKVGDDVLFVYEGKVREVRVQGMALGRNNEFILNFGGYPVQYAWGSEVGKTVFLTREEAEKALEGSAGTPVNMEKEYEP